MSHPETRYMSFLLRLWSADDVDSKRVWRASLESPADHSRTSFRDLDALFAFLAHECERAPNMAAPGHPSLREQDPRKEDAAA